MTLFLSHTTAAECWRSGRFDAALGGPSIAKRHRPAGALDVERVASMLAMDRLGIVYGEALAFGSAEARGCEQFKPRACEIRALREGRLAFASDPLHAIVPDKRSANVLKHLACHVHANALPSGSFVRVDDGLLLCSPELCFLHMATRLPFPHLVKLGFELCALYTLQPDGTASYGRPLPPTTARAIDAYLRTCTGMRGVATARQALRYVGNASGSPMETALAIVLCLPLRLGGYGLPLPYLNFRIDAPRHERAADGKSYYLCDLYWPQAKIAVEYDSDLEHTGSERIAEDAQRRNEVTGLGITTITVTREQVMNPGKLDRIARQLRRALHVRARSEREPNPCVRERLLRSLVTAKDLEASWSKPRKLAASADGR